MIKCFDGCYSVRRNEFYQSPHQVESLRVLLESRAVSVEVVSLEFGKLVLPEIIAGDSRPVGLSRGSKEFEDLKELIDL
jgi:sialic acid synthase SpsE